MLVYHAAGRIGLHRDFVSVELAHHTAQCICFCVCTAPSGAYGSICTWVNGKIVDHTQQLQGCAHGCSASWIDMTKDVMRKRPKM
jgi:hypothetical protein